MLALLGGALFLFLALDGNVDRLDDDGFHLSVLTIVISPHDDLRHNGEDRGDVPEQENACGGDAADVGHEHRHDDHHDGRLLLRIALKEHRHDDRRGKDRDHCEVGDAEQQAANLERLDRRVAQVGQDAIERKRGSRVNARGDVAEHLEQRDEDRHLQEDRQAARERVEVRLAVELLRLLGDFLLITRVELLNLLDAGLDLLHLVIRFVLLEVKREDDDSEYDRNDEDSESPVTYTALNTLDAVEDKILKCFPHRKNSESLRLFKARGRIHPHATDDTLKSGALLDKSP